MISRPLVGKTLLDLGNFESDKESSNDAFWQCFCASCPEIGMTLFWPDSSIEVNFVELKIVFPNLRLAVEEKFQNLLCERGLKISELRELESVTETVATLLREHPEWSEQAASGLEFSPKLDDNSNMRESEAVCRIRLGQTIYRRGLEQLWDGRCSVTGIGTRELLRASHAKPWAECETGAERICPYNGFLLVANLDALFDKFLVSFDDDGRILISSKLSSSEMAIAGITAEMKLRFISPEHLPFLRWHRKRFYGC